MKIFLSSILLFLSFFSHANELPTTKKNANDFFYAHQTHLWIMYEVSRSHLERRFGARLSELGLKVASFEDRTKGYIFIKPMKFMAGFGFQNESMDGISHTTEIEFTLLVLPINDKIVARSTFRDFLKGNLSDTRIGQLRIDVLADNPIAVSAGRNIFGEHKYLALFDYQFNAPNNTVGEKRPLNFHIDAFVWNDEQKRKDLIVSIQTSMDDLEFDSSNFEKEVLYSSFPQEPKEGQKSQTLLSKRLYQPNLIQIAFAKGEHNASIHVGNPGLSPALEPAPPFGDSQPIPGSEEWPQKFASSLSYVLTTSTLRAVMTYVTRPAVYEPVPVPLEQ